MKSNDRDKACQNVMAAVADAALARGMITLEGGGRLCSEAVFEFELAGLPVLARCQSVAGSSKIAMFAICCPTEMGREDEKWIDGSWQRYGAARVSGHWERRAPYPISYYYGSSEVAARLAEVGEGTLVGFITPNA